jgi:hypothetical protein
MKNFKKPVRMLLPIFLSNPPLVVGIPVSLAILFLNPEIPKSLFQEKLNPNLFLNPNKITN